MEHHPDPQRQPDMSSDQELNHRLGAFDLFTIGFGAIIGVGWVITIGDWINMAGGPYAAILAFLAGGVLLLPVALVFGELTAAIPVAGGAIIYTQRTFGTQAAFFTGWFLTLAYIMMCPWEVIAIGQLAESLIPAMKVIPLYTMGDYTIYLPTLLLCIVIAVTIFLLNNQGVEQAAKVQKLLVLVLLCISTAVILVAAFGGELGNTFPAAAPTSKNPDGAFLTGFLMVLASTPFFYSGFDTIGQEAEEVKSDANARRIGLVSPMSLCTASVFYAAVILAISMVLPWQQMLGLSLPAAEVFSVGMGLSLVKNIVIIGAFCGLLTTLNSFFVAGARVLLSMGRSHMIPEGFARVHPRYKTPVAANTLIGVVSLAGAFLGKSVLLPITNVCSLGFMLAWLMVCLASLKLKKTCPDLPRPLNVPRWLNILAVVFAGGMLLLLVVPGSPGALVWPLEVGIVLLWLILGIVFRVVTSRKHPVLLHSRHGDSRHF